MYSTKNVKEFKERVIVKQHVLLVPTGWIGKITTTSTKEYLNNIISAQTDGIAIDANLPSQLSIILYLHKSHNTPLLTPSSQHLHRLCFRFFLGHLHVSGEIANNDYAKKNFGGGERCIMGFEQVENNLITYSRPRLFKGWITLSAG